MFELYGIVKEGTTALGVAEMEGRHVLIAVALAEGMNDRQKKALESDLKTKLAHPDQSVSKDRSAALAEVFSDVKRNVITSRLSTPAEASSTVEPMLQETQCQRALFVCDNPKTYLEVCSELGISRNDFFRFAELKAMLKQQDKTKPKCTIGMVHKLIEDMDEKGGVSIPPTLSPAMHTAVAADINTLFGVTRDRLFDAHKFHLGKFSNLEQGNLEALTYPGNDYRLPFETCVFEYEVEAEYLNINGEYKPTKDGQVFDDGEWYPIPEEAVIEKSRATEIVIATQQGDDVFAHAYSRRSYSGHQGTFAGELHALKWSTDEQGKVLNVQYMSATGQSLDSATRDKVMEQSNYCLKIIAPALAALNEPRSVITTHHAKRAKKREKEGRPPFFSYSTIKIERPKDKHGVERQGNAVGGRKGTALHPVRAHTRRLASGDEIRVREHTRGDPRFGVVQSSFAARDALKPGGDEPA